MKIPGLERILLSAGVVWAAASPLASADGLGWFDFDGSIPGESLDSGHPDWIEVRGFSVGGRLGAGEPGAFGFVKRVDKGTPRLFLACASGTVFPKATLDLAYRNTSAGSFTPVRMEFVNLVVTRFASETRGELPVESVDLSYEKITYVYYSGPTDSERSSFDFLTRVGSGGPGFGSPGPGSGDVDRDGLDDDWERSFGFSTTTDDSAADPDGDGFTNIQEYRLGSNPKSGASFFKTTVSRSEDAPGEIQLGWESKDGVRYVIEWSPDLQTPFTTLDVVTAAGGTMVRSIPPQGRQGFYRVRPE